MKTVNTQTAFTIEHLSSDTINNIALSLDEDVYRASGDFDRWEIDERLIENIHRAPDYAYADSGLVPVAVVADLIRSVWEYEDRKHMELLTRTEDAVLDALDTLDPKVRS